MINLVIPQNNVILGTTEVWSVDTIDLIYHKINALALMVIQLRHQKNHVSFNMVS